MPRYRFKVEYDGGLFQGWQRQANGPSVQQAIEEAIFKFCGETVSLGVAGRTDAGVHAEGQVAHADLCREWPVERFKEAVNFHLKPQPIVLLNADLAPEGFDARFSARGRHYRYRIINRRPPLALDQGRAWQVKHPLDANAMHEAAQILIGTHDFTTFRHARCQAKSPVKTLDRLDVEREGDEITVYASSRSFLHNQVRSLVGSLVLVGDGKWDQAELKNALEARDRKRCGPVAPADGLYLYQVDYDDGF
ncbi:MAG: tRNA pseudouridine(38-40) synthase TruA [Pseudomonadota bacterium]